jgi:hypothetical protein
MIDLPLPADFGKCALQRQSRSHLRLQMPPHNDWRPDARFSSGVPC